MKKEYHSQQHDDAKAAKKKIKKKYRAQLN